MCKQGHLAEIALPTSLKETFLKHANTALTVQTGSWQQLGEYASAIRHEVFVQEQAVPVELELDEHDAIALHALAMHDGTPVGTARLLPDAHIGRMAVRKAYRGQGIGGLLLQALMQEARRRGDTHVVLAAQCHAQAFYRAHGFETEGEIFMDAGIEHILMRRVFDAAKAL